MRKSSAWSATSDGSEPGDSSLETEMKLDTGSSSGRPLWTVLFLVAIHASAACQQSSPPAEELVTPAPAPTKVELPQAVLPNGAEVTLELAQTPEEIERGLMFRPSLPGDRGMLFLFDEDRYPTFWMMNTLVALDLFYLDRTGTILEVVKNAQPCSAEPCPRFTSSQPSRAVLELVAGSAAEHGLSEGDRIEFVRVPGYPVVEN